MIISSNGVKTQQRDTSKPDSRLRFLIVAEPAFVPSMSKVNEQNQLDENEQKSSDHADHHQCYHIDQQMFNTSKNIQNHVKHIVHIKYELS